MMVRGKSFVLMLGLLLSVLYGCGGSSSHPANLATITVTPAAVTIAPGTTAQFSATGFFSDGTSIDLTSSATWSSSNTAVATVSNQAPTQGLATAAGFGGSTGSITITASSGGVSGSATLTVANLQSIAISPAAPAGVIVGSTQQFTATGTFSNGASQTLTSLASWSSSNSAVATVSAAGLATGVSPGTVQITAALGGATNSVTLKVVTLVSAVVSPPSANLDAGTSQQFTATGTLSDGTTRDVTTLLTWSSADPFTVAVGTPGLATALAPGSTTISASLQNVVLGSATVTVIAPSSIAVTPANATLVAGSTQSFTATGSFADGSTHDLTNLVTWSSSLPGVATISNLSGSRGLATGVANASGSTVISATLGSGAVAVAGSTNLTVKTLASLSVTPANPTLVKGSTLQLTATGTFTDGTTQDVTSLASWSSTTTTVATVSNVAGTKGLVSALNQGNAIIRASLAGSIASSTVTVSSTPATTPANQAYVTNFGGNTVSVVDTVGATLVATIPVGLGPRGIALNPATNRGYVANNDGTLSVLDLTNNALSASVNLQGGGGSWGVAVLPALNRVYVSNSFGGKLSVVDTTSNTLVTNITVGTSPKGIAVNPATSLVYVTNSGDNSVSVVNAATNQVVATITSVGLSPQEIALNTGAGRAYVANSQSNVVSVLNTASNAVLTTIAIETAHQGVAVNASTNRAYVSSSDGTVSVINTTTNAQLSSQASPFIVGPNPLGLAVRPATSQLFVVNNGNNTLSIVTTAADADQVTATVGVGAGPTEVAVLP